jgi:hypothetical protein
VPFWRRDEPVHKKLGRALMNAEAGGFLAHPPDLAGEPSPLGAPALHGAPRPRRWDAVVSAEAPRLRGDAVHFVALPDGTLVVDEDVPDDSLTPLAEAVETQLEPPYRAEGVRRGETVWAVAATRIDVVDVDEAIAGDVVELTVNGDQRAVLVDGERASATLSEFDQLANGLDAYVVRAERIDDTLWEVDVSPL